jgi:hypothetical protein
MREREGAMNCPPNYLTLLGTFEKPQTLRYGCVGNVRQKRRGPMAEPLMSTMPPTSGDLPPPPICCEEPMKLIGVVRPVVHRMGLCGYECQWCRKIAILDYE